MDANARASSDAAGVGPEPKRRRQGDESTTTTPKLPDEVWAKIFEAVDDIDVPGFAFTCSQLRRVQQESGRPLLTAHHGYKQRYYKRNRFRQVPSEALGEAWCLWMLSLASSARGGGA